MDRRFVGLALAGALLSACATTTTTPVPTPTPEPPKITQVPTPKPAPVAPTMTLEPVGFDQMPGWTGADLKPAIEAFRRQCQLWAKLPAEALVNSNGAPYGGPVSEWKPACAAAAAASDPRAFFEANFTPERVVAQGGDARLTAYFFPRIHARHTSAPGFSEPLLPKPADMVSVDMSAFAARLGEEAPAGLPRALTGQLVGDRVVPYPVRSDIMQAPHTAFAWASPAEVYKLQVQGSGRLVFDDGGDDICASFAAQNGAKWASALDRLRKAGVLAPNPRGSWAALHDYFDAHPEAVRAALDADPSYVFFFPASPSSCPKGAGGAVLVARGSLAVDPRFHPYGALIFVSGPTDPAFPRLLVAQDTGGAIRRGPLRGDVFMGEGDEAGMAALAVNAIDPAWWTLVPKPAP